MKRSRRHWLSAAQVLVALVTMLAFCTWAPWMAAISREEAVVRYQQPIPVEWKAVVMGHGQIANFRWGTLHENPWGFALCTLVVFAGWLFLVLSVRYTRRSAHASRGSA